ncbi:amino acid permease 8-like [Euphorbia lathyris]|uniref:amino acid permease 8-like n=1 Tax=Euphorbia lathyris TaxID=212925 RepID=UPI0033131384
MDVEGDAGVEDDGRIRTGNLGTATAHAFTAAVGAGILALPWSMAQLGWILGCIVLISFALITYFTAILLADCYRTPDPVHGKRNYTYITAVRSLLGPTNEILCAIMQYALLWGTMIGYTVTTAISVAAVRRTTCFHANGQHAKCGVSGNIYMLVFGVIQIVLSQFPNLEKVAFLSVFASATSFAYAIIALGLSIAKLFSNHHVKGTLMVAYSDVPEAASAKVWHVFQALGNIALAYTFSMILLEIQDTLKSSPPENKVMKKATMFAIGGTTMFYITLGCMGYAAFGTNVAGNILAGFYHPYWLVVIANLCVILHIVGAYQVFGQPIFAINEKFLTTRFPASTFTTIYTIKLPCTKKSIYSFTLSKLLLRPLFVVVTTLLAMMFPFFNGILGLLGAIAFWPLTVQFPLRMYTEQFKIKKWSCRWICFQLLSFVSLIVTLVSGIGSVASMLDSLKKAKLFHINL